MALTLTDYLTNGLNLSKAQVEAITKLSEACGMIDLFEGASPWGNVLSKLTAKKQETPKKVKESANTNTTEDDMGSLFDTSEDAELDDLITPEGNAIGLANAGFQYGEEADSEGDSTLSNFYKDDLLKYKENLNRHTYDENPFSTGEGEADISKTDGLMTIVKRMAEWENQPESKVKRFMKAAADADMFVANDQDASAAINSGNRTVYDNVQNDRYAAIVDQLSGMVKAIAAQCHSLPSDDDKQIRDIRELATNLVKKHNTPFVQMVGFDQLAFDNDAVMSEENKKATADQVTSLLGGAGLAPNTKVGSSKDYYNQQFKGRRKLQGTFRK